MDPCSDTHLTGTEREVLDAFLHDQRQEIASLLDGLTDEQARRRLVSSLTTVLGLVKHAAFVERVWFHVALAGGTRAQHGLPDTVDESFTLTSHDTVASVVADYRLAWREAEEIAARHELDDLALHNRRSPLSLRWIYGHMVRELARHAGHGDILREQILAADGG